MTFFTEGTILIAGEVVSANGDGGAEIGFTGGIFQILFGAGEEAKEEDGVKINFLQGE